MTDLYSLPQSPLIVMVYIEVLSHVLTLELENELKIVVGASDVNSSLEGLTARPHYCHNSQCQQSNLGTKLASGALSVGEKVILLCKYFRFFFFS